MATVDNLDRLGLVLNFLAGFLLAPELLGERRILRWEQRLEEAARNYESIFVTRAPNPLGRNIRHIQLFIAIVGVVVVVSYFIFVDRNRFWMANIFYLIWFSVTFIVLLKALRSSESLLERAYNKDEDLGRSIVTIMNASFIFTLFTSIFMGIVWEIVFFVVSGIVVAIFVSLAFKQGHFKDQNKYSFILAPIFFIFLWPPVLSLIVLGPITWAFLLASKWLLRSMDPASPKLKGHFVTLGVFFFIIGNAMQLGASYF